MPRAISKRDVAADPADPADHVKFLIKSCFSDSAQIVDHADRRSIDRDHQKELFVIKRLNFGWILIGTAGVSYQDRHKYNRLRFSLESSGDLVEINEGWRFRFKLTQGRD